MSRNFRSAVVLFGCTASTLSVGAPIDVLFPITEVGLHESAGRSSQVQSLGTAFGRSSLRQADYVVNGASWASGRLLDRAPREVTDMDLASEPGAEEATLGNEVAVMFARGYSSLHAGPDVFIVDASKRVTKSVTVTPVYRVNGETLVEGASALVSPEAAFGFVSAGGREVGGVGIDLDGWSVQGMAPEGALLVGVVFRAADGEDLGHMKLMLGESLDPGEYIERRPGGGGSINNLVYRGGARDGSGGGGGDRASEPIVPSAPSAVTTLMALTLAGLRRRRA